MNNLGKLLWSKKPYFVFSLATLLSGIGTAFSTVAVYGEFAIHNVSPIFYSLAFLLSVAPGLIASVFAGKYANKLNIALVLVSAEVVGGLSLIVPIIGLTSEKIVFLLFAEFIGSALTGFLIPFHRSLIRRTFSDEELASISVYEVYIFTATFLLGQALGTLIYSFVGALIFFQIDFLTYLFASILIFWASRMSPDNFRALEGNDSDIRTFRWRELNTIQKRVFMIMPLLSLVCSPSMSLLPARGAEFGISINYGAIVLAPALFFLLLKTVGQLIGPQIIEVVDIDKLVDSNWVTITCLGGFLVFYYIVFTTDIFWLAAVSVVFAHILSNIVYIIASYGLSRHFSEVAIASASAKSYQFTVLSMTISGFLAGIIAEVSSLLIVVGVSLLPLMLITVHLYKQSYQKVEGIEINEI
ncbi:hypothetical protein [Gynuella sp.]|uniref:hypothetical protein n=1 Tax=Gynuella sp. TaxID=2969146 RepID=UPI003D0D02BC